MRAICFNLRRGGCFGCQNATLREIERGVGPMPLVAANQVKHATTNQRSATALGGLLKTICFRGGMCGGNEFASFGAAIYVTKKKKNYIHRGIDDRRDDEHHTTTNQKMRATRRRGGKIRVTGRGHWGSANETISGRRSSVM